MSLFWERAVSNSPTQQNVDSSEMSTTAGGAQQQANWDCINLGNAPPTPHQSYQWSHEQAASSKGNSRANAPNYVDPYGAAVMGVYQQHQGPQNVVYPYQQHRGSPKSHASSATPQLVIAQHVAADQNCCQQQQHSPLHSPPQYHQQQQLQRQQQASARSGAALQVQPSQSQQVHHTLVASRQPRAVEHQVVPSPRYTPTHSEPQLVPLAVISPAVALSSAAVTTASNPLSSVQPFNSRSSPTEAVVLPQQQQAHHYRQQQQLPQQQQRHYQQRRLSDVTGTTSHVQGNSRVRTDTDSSRHSPFSYIAVQPLLSVQSLPSAAPIGRDAGVAAQVGDSAQVTPESSYSVDTFGSSSDPHAEQQQVVNTVPGESQTRHVARRSDDNWEDDWEQTEHPERSVAREVSPTEVASQTHSEPPGYSSSYPDTPCATRESSMAPHHEAESTPHRADISADIVRIAPVPATPSTGVVMFRYEESSRSQDHAPAVAQVAPLRPEPDSIQSAPVSTQPSAAQTSPSAGRNTERSVDAGAPLHHPSPSPTIDAVSSQLTMNDDANVSTSIHLPSESVIDTSHDTATVPASVRVTPDVLPANESLLSPVVVATSTPVDNAESANEKRNPENHENNGWAPSNDSRMASNQSGIVASADHSDSTTGSLSTRNGPERRSVQSRYKKFKEHFSGIMGRLDQYRAEPSRNEFRSSSRTGNPLMANVTNSLGRRSVLVAAKNGPQVRPPDGVGYGARAEEGVAVYQQSDPSQSYLFDANHPAVYGDDFVNAARRSRKTRLSRPNSRTKVEYSSAPFEHDPSIPREYQTTPPGTYANYPTGRRSAHTATGTAHHQEYMVQKGHAFKDRRRPMSSFDQRAMERYQRAGGRYGHYDAYNAVRSSVSDSDSENVERGDSEEEIRKYTRKGRFGGPGESFDSLSVGEEMYYLGTIHLDQARVRLILTHFPPPMEYHRLPPIEKAAYLFYVAVYKKQYKDIEDFHKKFNREYYKYTCDGDSDDIALWKICKSMQEEFHSKKLAESQKAYEATQRQLFSDERESADGMSERASMEENHDDRTSDILSVDSSQRGPLKYRLPHAFVSFGPGGKMVTVHPDLSVSVVQINDVKAVAGDSHSVRLIESAQSFKGPLLTGQTPTHSVRLYIERQIKKIRGGDLAVERPSPSTVVDCLLIWQLLGMIVQQQGRVTGLDVARLLVDAGSVPSRASSLSHQTHHSSREKSVTPADSTTTAIAPGRIQIGTDSKAYERFTELLLGGHIVEAIDSALRDGLYADAMVLARRLLANDVAKLAEIEERVVAIRPQCSPVVTLVSVASKNPVPILMNPTGDENGSWRTHVAIILANLTSSEAMNTVYELGEALAKREFHCAADFCFLAVCILAGFNPFKALDNSSTKTDGRQHITLIHAGLPDDEASSVQCRYGFSLIDLHATEIFDYAIRLSDLNAYSPLGDCIDYQRKRIQYAHLIAEFGGFATDAFRYCMEIARAIWNYYHLLSAAELNELCDLADRLRYAASASEWETTWISSMRAMIQQKEQYQGDEIPEAGTVAVQQSAPPATQSPISSEQYASPMSGSLTVDDSEPTSPHPEATSGSRSRTSSLTAEARDWHAQRQDPLQMSPVGPHSATDEENEGCDVRGRSASNSTQHGAEASAKHVSDKRMHPSTLSYASSHANTDDKSSVSEETSAQSTSESTPVRNVNHQGDRTTMTSQSIPDFPQLPQSPPAAYTTQSAQLYSERRTAALPQNGLPETNMTKSSSTQGSKGFFGSVKEKLLKAIPIGNEMILPDDSKPSIVWDPVKGRYVGAGVEEEATSAPPPKLDGISQSNSGSGGLRAARNSGGSRYFNPLNQASTNGGGTQSPAPTPVMPVPATFGFIPNMPASDDSTGDSVDPFSGQANPTVHGAELTQAQ